MSTTDSTASPLTHATAWKSFARLRRRVKATPQLNVYYKSLQVAADAVLDNHLVEESIEDTEIALDDPEEVIETLQSVLPAPSTIFGDDFFTSSVYPVRVLFDIAGLYQARAIEVGWLNSLCLPRD